MEEKGKFTKGLQIQYLMICEIYINQHKSQTVLLSFILQ